MRLALALLLAATAHAQVPDIYGVSRTPGVSIAATVATTAPPPAATALPPIPLGVVLNATDVSWKAFQGRVVLLDFFSFTCKPCLKAMPDIVKLQAAHAGKLQVIGYHIGRGGLAEVEPIVKKFDIKYPVIIPPDADDPRVMVPGAAFLAQFGSEALPCAAVIGADGKLAAWNLSPEQVGPAVAKALAR